MSTEEILALKPKADEIMATPGNTKGNSLYTDMQFVLEREGQHGLEELEAALSLLGYPFSYKSVKGFDWYPEGQAVLGIFVAQKLFDWSEEDVFEMGYAAPSTSLLVKTVVRFISAEVTFRQAPSMWEKHYDFGRFDALEFNAEEKFLSFRVSDYGFFDYMEEYFDGFFTKIFELVGISSVESLEGVRCDGDSNSCRLYKVRWK